MSPPEDQQLLINQALEHHQSGRISDALALYETALNGSETNANLLYLLGTAYYQTQRFTDAEQMLQRSIDIDSGNAGAYSNRGLALDGLGRFEEALECFDMALQTKPDFSGALSNRGSTLKQIGRLDESLASFNAAITIRPDYAEAYYNRGLILSELDRCLLAVESYERAIKLNPSNPEPYSNRGNALRELSRFDAALSSYDSALQLNPNYPEANWNKSYLLLLLGEYMEGWRLYEWRRRLPLFQNAFRPQGNPLLPDTEINKDSTIFIYSEQGLGDTLQFCRYVKLLANKTGANIQFQIPKILRPLLSSLPPKVTLVTSDDGYPTFDFQTSVMSLPWILGTSLESIPKESHYLSASHRTTASWERRLGLKTKPRIGLVWSGALEHSNDRKRSIPLNQLVSIINPAFEWHAIQTEYRESDRDTLLSHPEIIQHADQLVDLDETAGLLEQMDLLISVDTCVAHLAGTLGKPVWILLPHVPDFRWLIDRDDSPWYPSARLYRQDRTKTWAPVLKRLCGDLLGNCGLNR